MTVTAHSSRENSFHNSKTLLLAAKNFPKNDYIPDTAARKRHNRNYKSAISSPNESGSNKLEANEQSSTYNTNRRSNSLVCNVIYAKYDEPILLKEHIITLLDKTSFDMWAFIIE